MNNEKEEFKSKLDDVSKELGNKIDSYDKSFKVSVEEKNFFEKNFNFLQKSLKTPRN